MLRWRLGPEVICLVCIWGHLKFQAKRLAPSWRGLKVVETLQRNVLKGIGLNAVLKDLSPQMVPSIDSTDDTLGHSWEGLRGIPDCLEVSAAKPLEIGDMSEVW